MRSSAALAVFAALAACGADPAPDGGELPAACAPMTTPAGWTYPSGPYGAAEVGTTLAEFTLEDCDGAPIAFGDVLSEAELVLVSVGAGWCQPCIEETETLEAEVHVPYCERGLRVIQVLFQDAESLPATKLFCRQWRERFGLRFAVVVDPLFTFERYFESAQTPLNLLVDRDAVVRFRATGTAPADLPARIDQLLPR